MANPKQKSRRRKIILFSAVGVLVALVGVLVAVKHREQPVAISKEKVIRRDVTETVVANGKIQPVVEVTISPEVSGEIIELPVKEGQNVKKGDLLVKIRPDTYLAAYNSALANYHASIANTNTAASNLERARLEYEREKQLYKSALVSDSDFLTVKTTYDVAVATLAGAVEQVAVAQAALDSAEADLTKTTIYSPLDGTVTRLNSQLGERVVGTAMMAGTEIMTVSDLNAMEARVDLGEIDVVLVAVGQAVKMDVDAFKDRKFTGTVTEIANSANNATTGTGTASSSSSSSSSSSQDATKFQVKIRIAEKELFRPGMSVTANIETRYRTNVLTVPIQCVTTRMPKGKTNSVAQVAGADPAPATGGTNVATQVSSNVTQTTSETNDATTNKKPNEPVKPVEVVFLVNGDHVNMAPVKRGISDDNYVEIVDGLKEGQEVVTGTYKAIAKELDDGKAVKVDTHAAAATDKDKTSP
jgi:HlyD family secretion protein